MGVLLLVRYTAKPDLRGRFLQEVAESGILRDIRAEAGCQHYAYYLDAENDERILLVEKWASAAQQEQHLTQPHMARLLAIKERYIDDTRVERVDTPQE